MRRTKDNTREVLEMDSDPEVWRNDLASRSRGETAAEITLDNVPGPGPVGRLDPSLVDGDTNAEDGLAESAVERPGYFGESARIGRFAVLRQLGEGGMGVVYSAYDEELDRRVALKLLRPGRDNSPRNQARMQREARAMAKLSHPNVVQVYEVGRFEEQVFVAMEFVQGRTLGVWLRAQERSWLEIIGVMIQAGRGLQAAHEAGVIHADFKPDNVLIDAEDRVRVVDFGLSRRADPASASLRAAASSSTAGGSRTGTAEAGASQPAASLSLRAVPRPTIDLDESGRLRPGEEPRSNARIAGTPAYMAPEQHRHHPADQRSDQFSFCVTLFTALYGKHPFAGGSLLELVINLTDGKMHPPPADTQVPANVHAVVVRGLAVEREARWPSLAEMLDALEKASGRDKDPEFDLSVAKHQRVVLAGIVAASSLGMSIWVILGSAKDLMPSPQVNAMAGAGINAVLFTIIFVFRGPLLKNTINRRVTAWLVVSSIAMLVHRVITMLLDVPVPTTMALDLLLLGSIAALAATTVERWIGWTATLLLTSAMLAALLPGFSSVILAIAVVGVFCLAVLFWSR
ncbi:MAG TPA: serine/threonine-protein kinase [Nannocystis sp.]|jgi:serine/threonine-protein kinase